MARALDDVKLVQLRWQRIRQPASRLAARTWRTSGDADTLLSFSADIRNRCITPGAVCNPNNILAKMQMISANAVQAACKLMLSVATAQLRLTVMSLIYQQHVSCL